MSTIIKGIEERAMLCHVEVHFYGFHKYDRDASEVTEKEMKATKDSGRFNKSLIEREGIRFLRSTATDIRRYHRRNTLPWGEGESRILPSANFIDYMKGLREKIADFDKSADKFCGKLPDLYKRAEKNLGKMYNASDYIDPKLVREKYSAKVNITPVPLVNDFRVTSLDKEDIAQIKKEFEKDKVEAIKKAMTALWERIESPIQKMVEKLSQKDGEFRDSLINNISKIVELVPKLNLGDANIEKFAKDVKHQLCKIDPKDLRKDNTVRKNTIKTAKEILDKMSAYC